MQDEWMVSLGVHWVSLVLLRLEALMKATQNQVGLDCWDRCDCLCFICHFSSWSRDRVQLFSPD